MGYFPIDDQMSFHPKVMAAGNAAIGLWSRAGAWAKNHVTGGFIPTETANAMGSRAEIKKLVFVGLWEEVLGGYYFHDWEHYGANRTGAAEEAERDQRRAAKREADRIRQQRKRDKERDVTPTVTRDNSVTEGVTQPVTVTPEVTHHVTPSSRARWTSPSPSPVVVLSEISPVPETSRADTTPDPETATPEQQAAAARLRVDFDKVADRIAIQAGERVPAHVTARIIAEVVRRAKPRDGDRTGLVLGSIQRDWAEWSRLVFQVAS